MKNIKLATGGLILTLTLMSTSCKKFVTIGAPSDQVSVDKVFSSDETTTEVIRGIYSRFMSFNGFASGNYASVTVLAGRSADDFINQSALDEEIQFSTNNLSATNATLRSGLWTSPYQTIYSVNSIIENLANAPAVSTAVKQQVVGEAKFIRALCYFYLTNLFGDVPLILSTDYNTNAVAAKSTTDQVYTQVIQDLSDAENQLSDSYPSTERIRANKWAAAALLARTYLYTKQYDKAEAQATSVISQSMYALDTDLNQAFLKNSTEAILQFAVPAALNVNTWEGSLFILTTAPSTTTSKVTLNPALIAAFEAGDARASKWIGTYADTSYYAYKYKTKIGATPSTEYSMVLRLAEQYLIRAEARINQNKVDQGIADLNIIRTRARASATLAVPHPLPNLPDGMSQSNALLAVEHERRMELFSEWGHRWLDLKRTKRADAVLAAAKGTNWQSADTLYPIPNSDILNDPNLVQNPGY